MPLSKTRGLLIGRLRRRKTREREQAFLAEGIRCCTELVGAGADIRFAVVSPRLDTLAGGAVLRDALRERHVETVLLSDAELDEHADTEHPQGVLLVCRQPRTDLLGITAPHPRLLVADAIRDPGNLGTLIRSAAAFDLDAVIVLDGTVDPFNPKTVRAAAGSLLRPALIRAGWQEFALFFP